MGIDTDRFVETVPQEALCPVCCLVLEEPVLTSCGHYICHDCLQQWRARNKQELCPYCCTAIVEKGIRPAVTVRSLIANFNVYCQNVQDGCSSVHKLGLEDIHIEKCAFSMKLRNRSHSYSSDMAKNTCETCLLAFEDTATDMHDCLQALSATCKRLGNQVVNLEYENEKLSLRLTKKENDELDHVTELESLYQQEILRYEKEIRELKLQMSGLEGELNRIRSGSEESVHEVIINRKNGTLGFNIIGGFQEGKGGSGGIVVSRIAESSAADGPDKLCLHDRILKVNGINLENASHDEAVRAFRCSRDPVHIFVQRRVRRDPPKMCEKESQTDALCREDIESTSRSRTKTCELTDSPCFSCSEEECNRPQVECDRDFVQKHDEILKPIEFYDSAYDTLLTHKSSKSTKSSSLSSEITRDDEIDTNEIVSTSLDLNANESEMLLNKRLGNEVYCDVVRSEDSSGSSIFLPPKSPSSVGSRNSRKSADSSSSKNESRRPVRKDLSRCLCNSPQLSPRCSPRKFVKKNVFYFVPESETGPSTPHITSRDTYSSGSAAEKDTESGLNNRKLHLEEWEDEACVGFDISDGYEYEYEEILLSKVDGRFGFELCYGGDEESLAVYVGEIEEESVAEQDGRIMVGDQIIMINDCHVNVVEEAYRILQENNQVKLLVARPVYEINSPEVEEEETDLDLLDAVLETVKEETSGAETAVQVTAHDNTGETSGKVDQERSAVTECKPQGKVQDSEALARKEDSVQCGAENEKEPVKASPFFLTIENQNIKNKATESNKDKKQSEPKEDLRSTLKRYVLAKLRGDSDNRSTQDNKATVENDTGKKKDSAMQKGQIFQNSCAFDSDENNVKLSGSLSLKHRSLDSKGKGNRKAGSEPKTKSQTDANGNLRSALKKNEGRSSSKKQVRVDNKPNWTTTEKRVWEEFKLIQHMEAQENKAMVWGQPDQELEWKVRRSKDGKHIYIRKQSKPARSKMLKERAQRVAEERRGITTDEDTQSVYLGKYWTREERRHQLNRQREKRRRLLQRINEKNSINGAEAAIAEIVQRNMTSPGKIFDDFFTVEEILMQRNRDGFTDGPIHVTTV